MSDPLRKEVEPPKPTPTAPQMVTPPISMMSLYASDLITGLKVVAVVVLSAFVLIRIFSDVDRFANPTHYQDGGSHERATHEP